MRPLFLHPGFPGPFALVAQYAAVKLRWESTLITHVDTRHLSLPFNHINYRLRDDVPSPATFTNPESLIGLLEHMAAIYRGLRGVDQIRPDLVVGHLSYGTMLYLRNLYTCPFVGYFELYPGTFWNDGLVLRPEFPPTEPIRLMNATYHALTLMQLRIVDAAYTPTTVQRDMCPAEYRDKVRVVPEGVDCQTFQPRPRPTSIGEWSFDSSTPVVTYVSRGLESVRGFDLFMAMAKKLSQRRPDVRFVIVGAERTLHGHELLHTGGQSFKQWVLSREQFDLSRFHFLHQATAEQVAAVFNLSDLHVHLSVPYIPSPSVLQAMASGCVILASDVPGVRERIDDGINGRLVPWGDVEQLTTRAEELLTRKDLASSLRREARLRALESFEAVACLERLTEFFKEYDSGTKAIDQAFAGL